MIYEKIFPAVFSAKHEMDKKYEIRDDVRVGVLFSGVLFSSRVLKE